jgi:phosphatidylglycerophosphatase A
MRAVIVFLATGLYSGKSPVLPGTGGTLAALPLVWVFSRFGAMGYFFLTGVFVYLSIWIADLYEREFQRHDRPEVVIDEMAGFLISMCLLPLSRNVLLAAFVLFRALDMIKPFPISVLDKKVPGGYGVVIDDLLAGLITNVVLQVVVWKTDWLGHF